MALGASSTNIQLHYDTVNIHTTTSNHTCENQAFFFFIQIFLDYSYNSSIKFYISSWFL